MEFMALFSTVANVWGHFGAPLVKHFKGPIICVVGAAVVFGSGWVMGVSHQKGAEVKAAQAETAQVVNTANKNNEKVRTVYVQDLARVRALEADNSRLEKQVSDLQSKVNDNVPEHPGDTLSIGAVRLLDSAAIGLQSASTGSGRSAAVSTGEDSAASDVTWRELVSADLGVRGQYNKAAGQCNALIDWVETNIVQPQTVKPSK